MDIIYRGITLSDKNSVDNLRITNSDTDYLMIQCAISLDGNIKKTDNFDGFVKYAEENKIPYGVYYTTNSLTITEIKKESDFVFDLLKDKKMQYPVYIEQVNTDKSKRKQATDVIVAFCGNAWLNNIYSGFRCTPEYLRNNLEFNRLRRYNYWLVCNSDRPGNTYIPFGMWEHTDEYRLDNTLNMYQESYCIQNYPKVIRQGGLNGF